MCSRGVANSVRLGASGRLANIVAMAYDRHHGAMVIITIRFHIGMPCTNLMTPLHTGFNEATKDLVHHAPYHKMVQELPPERMEALISAAGRIPLQRTTSYHPSTPTQKAKSFAAQPLAPLVMA